MASLAITVLTGIIIAAVSSWITVQLSLRRFRAEKWWERRVNAYERVIDALHDAKTFNDVHLDALYDGREVAEDRDEELRAKSKEAHAEIGRAVDIGAFLLSENAQNRLRQYQKEARAAGAATSWHEYLENDRAATNACLEDIIKIARQDVKT